MSLRPQARASPYGIVNAPETIMDGPDGRMRVTSSSVTHGNPSKLVRDGPIGRKGSYRLLDARCELLCLGVLDWADFGHDGALLLGRDGRLCRQGANHTPARLVADLKGYQFERVAPSRENLEWPKSLRRRPHPWGR